MFIDIATRDKEQELTDLQAEQRRQMEVVKKMHAESQELNKRTRAAMAQYGVGSPVIMACHQAFLQHTMRFDDHVALMELTKEKVNAIMAEIAVLH